jgi:hypothetical protein
MIENHLAQGHGAFAYPAVPGIYRLIEEFRYALRLWS